jgi:hypothetical protein
MQDQFLGDCAFWMRKGAASMRIVVVMVMAMAMAKLCDVMSD